MNRQAKRHQGCKLSAPSAPKQPIIGICGHSGAGKTTLIEAMLPELMGRGLRVAVVKHDCRNPVVDCPGKDSDRLYRAGADVFLLGGEEFSRVHGDGGAGLAGLVPCRSFPCFSDKKMIGEGSLTRSAGFVFQLSRLVRRYDLVLVEGHGQTPVSKIWLSSEGVAEAPAETEDVLDVFPRSKGMAARIFDYILQWLQDVWLQTPVWACVLIGGRSSRMGQPKHLIEKQETRDSATWLEHTVGLLQPLIGDHIVLSGGGLVPESLSFLPRLPDIPDVCGPLTGILAAMRWQPEVSWLLVACDMPDISTEAVSWLLSQRRPGCWGTVPRLHEDGYVEPLLAHYDYRCGPLFERLVASGSLRMSLIARQGGIETPLVPPALRSSWHNINTPEELAVSRQARRV